jgi:CrcB protein
MLLVGLGGGVGSMLRYLGTHGLYKLIEKPFPFGTLFVNILGCFLAGLVSGLLLKMGGDERIRLLLMVGFCGGFTTFSAFAHENMSMIQSGNYLGALLYITLSVITGLVAVWLGMMIKL